MLLYELEIFNDKHNLLLDDRNRLMWASSFIGTLDLSLPVLYVCMMNSLIHICLESRKVILENFLNNINFNILI